MISKPVLPYVHRIYMVLANLIHSSQAAVNPDEAVALGAAVQAGVLQGEVKDLMIMDQWQVRLDGEMLRPGCLAALSDGEILMIMDQRQVRRNLMGF